MTRREWFLAGALIIGVLGALLGGCCASPYWSRCSMKAPRTDGERMRKAIGCGIDREVIPPPLANFRPIDGNPYLHEIKKIRDFVERVAPGSHMVITPHNQRPTIGYERLPFRWRDLDVYIKRPPISDRRGDGTGHTVRRTLDRMGVVRPDKPGAPLRPASAKELRAKKAVETAA